MLVGLVSDTHVPYRAKSMPLAAWRVLAGCDLLLHAGDVCDPQLLDEMAQLAPVHAVVGNVDGPDLRAWGAGDELTLEVAGVIVSMLHDSGAAQGREQRMRKRFPGSRVVIFGHSHLPLVEQHDDLLLINPGSPTDRRRAPTFTVGLLRVEAREVNAELVHLS
ncbi:MAG TPA: metallophosphoesterase family protein [Actinomycetota bacterium]|nr:metallophosphoesterase family protein [Actinomycetota bacterium]